MKKFGITLILGWSFLIGIFFLLPRSANELVETGQLGGESQAGGGVTGQEAGEGTKEISAEPDSQEEVVEVSEEPEADTFETYYASGAVSSRRVLFEGKPQGPQRQFFPDGTLWKETNFIKGEREGAGRRYYESSALEAEHYYTRQKSAGPCPILL